MTKSLNVSPNPHLTSSQIIQLKISGLSLALIQSYTPVGGVNLLPQAKHLQGASSPGPS